jgi:predicted acylesterase/phospholipase RssA
MEFLRIAVLTIQGGGAVAIDLIGQLQGLTGRRFDENNAPTHDQGLLCAGVAGASAGAIIATLYWAGYSPPQIRDEVIKLFAADRIEAFFGRSEGLFFGLQFQAFSSVADVTAATFRGPTHALKRLVSLESDDPSGRDGYRILAILARLLKLPFLTAVTLFSLRKNRGLFPGDGMVKEIDRLLRESPLLRDYKDRLPQGTLLRFDDLASLHNRYAIPLFLIVTDLRNADLKVISSIDQDCRQINIAEAVRASAGFPGFFQPTRLSDTLDVCVDGGVVSNFPAWIFGIDYRAKLRRSGDPQLEELAYTPWLHVGLKLPADPAPTPTSFGGFLRGLTNMLTGRARARLDDKLANVNPKSRSVRPVAAATDGAPAGVLDFSALSNPDLVQAAYRRGRINGQQAIEHGCFDVPPRQAVEPLLKALVKKAEFILSSWTVPGSVVRANIFIPQEDGSLVLVYQANMDGDCDCEMRFASGQGITSLVYSRRAIILSNLEERRHSFGEAPGDEDLYLTREGAPTIRKDRNWLFSIPLIDATEMWPQTPSQLHLDFDGPVLGVLNIDAALDYSKGGAPSPERAFDHPAALALFDVMKTTALQCSVSLTQRLVRQNDVVSGSQIRG